MTLRIGCVKYLNARPLIHGWPDHVKFDHPSALCQRLARGDVDLALVSSFEFLRNPIYRIVGEVSISSVGPVYSVVVAHRGEISEIDQVELDPAAETSVNLLRCLLAESNLNPRLVVAGGAPATRSSEIQERARTRPSIAKLLIGDQAILFRQEHAHQFNFWDLGEQWTRLVDFPFVYALWLIRPEVVDAEAIANRLRALRDANLANIDQLIAQEKDFDHDFCRRYYRDNLRFEFGEKGKEGLRNFQRLCQKHDLLPKREIDLNLV
jgi:chorismate dehydratase